MSSKNRVRTASRVIPGVAAMTACAMLAASGLAENVKQVAPTHPEAAQAEREAVAATFVTHDDGAIGKVLPPAPAPAEKTFSPWDRPKAQVPIDLLAQELPSFYMYSGEPVRLNLDVTRVAIKLAGLGVDGDEALVRAAAAKAGVAAAKIDGPGVAGWRFVTLAAPRDAGDFGGINAVLELFLADPAIEFASPVFEDPAIPGGFVIVTPEINVRVREANVANVDGIVAAAAKNMQVVQRDFAGLVGAVQLRATDRNGFRVLKAANDLAMDARFAWAEPDKVAAMDLHYTPNDDFWTDVGMWGWENSGAGAALTDFDTDASAAFDLTRGNPVVRVLVMDTGTQQNHPDINQLAGQDFTTGAVNGTGTGDPLGSCDDHGTPVAGIIAGRINNGIGGAGVCPNSRVIAARIASQQTAPCSSLFGSFSTSWVANAINWGAGQSVRITNSSFGCGASDTLTDAYQTTSGNGILHFASTGNGGSDGIGDPTIGYPASISGIASIGAVDNDGTLSDFSNWGSSMNFVAPGTTVLATDQTGSNGYVSGDYMYFGGTSAASPFAAGVAALVWSAYPDRTKDEILAILNSNCRDMGAAGYDTVYGYGFPNANSALRSQSPFNTWCATATLIPSSAFSYSAGLPVANAASPVDGAQENCELNDVGVSHAVWYRFDPPCVGTLGLNTNGSTYDTVLSVFRGSCDAPVQVACDDDSGTGTQSQILDLTVSPSFTYYIKVSAYGVNNAGGQLDFNFTYDATPPANDLCADATTITVTPWTSVRCTVGATNQICEFNEPCEVSGVGTSKSVWWEYTPSVNGTLDIDTAGSAIDTVLSVWTGCPFAVIFNGTPTCLGLSSPVACDDDGGAGTTSLLAGVPVRKNTTYRIKVASYSPTALGGDMTLHVNFNPCPADYNVSGTVTVQDIFDFLADYFSGDIDADVNNSGSVTVQDIFDYLALYFAGCA